MFKVAEFSQSFFQACCWKLLCLLWCNHVIIWIKNVQRNFNHHRLENKFFLGRADFSHHYHSVRNLVFRGRLGELFLSNWIIKSQFSTCKDSVSVFPELTCLQIRKMACTEIRLFNEKIIEEKSLQNFEINFCEKSKIKTKWRK